MGLPDNCAVKLQNKFAKGGKNLITDVPGVKVGQVTLEDGEKDIHTGVTAIFPQSIQRESDGGSGGYKWVRQKYRSCADRKDGDFGSADSDDQYPQRWYGSQCLC